MNTELILVVEDTALVRNQLRARFDAEGYRVVAAATVAEALECVRTHMPDAVILDLHLMDCEASRQEAGFSFLRALRGTYSAADPVVIIFSANDSPEVHARAHAAGVFATIAKKQGTTALMNAVTEALAERKEAIAARDAA